MGNETNDPHFEPELKDLIEMYKESKFEQKKKKIDLKTI